MTAWVYRCLDSTDATLYVGTTTQLGNRLGQHERSAEWWPEVESVLFDRYPDEASAHQAEAALILATQPSYNVRHRGTVYAAPDPWTELIVLRSKDGLNMTDLAKAASMSLGYLCDLENGKRKPSARVTKLLAQTLNVPVSMLEKQVSA